MPNTPQDIRKLALEIKGLLTKFSETEEEHQHRLRAVSISAAHLSHAILSSPDIPSEGVDGHGTEWVWTRTPVTEMIEEESEYWRANQPSPAPAVDEREAFEKISGKAEIWIKTEYSDDGTAFLEYSYNALVNAFHAGAKWQARAYLPAVKGRGVELQQDDIERVAEAIQESVPNLLNPDFCKVAAKAAIEAMSLTGGGVEANIVEALKALAPFELVQGDTIHRTNPESRQVCNSNIAWAVSGGEKSAHKLRRHVETLNSLVAALSQQTPSKEE